MRRDDLLDLNEVLQHPGRKLELDISSELPEETEIELAKPLEGYLEAVSTGNLLLLTGKFETAVIAECARCGGPLEVPVDFELEEQFAVEGVPSSYSYEDTYSDPNLRVTNQRVVSYKLLKFKDFILYDQVSGVSGRPTTGFFSVFLGFFGDGSVKQSRSAITADGLQIVRTRAQLWGLSKTVIVTIQKNGRAAEGIDRTRGDIRAIETTLKRELRIRYRQE